VAAGLQAHWQQQAQVPLQFTGLLPREHIAEIDRSAHLLYSADVNAACPNSVVEALACGLPVAGFDTGALPELISDDAGRTVPYGGDVWRLKPRTCPHWPGRRPKSWLTGALPHRGARPRQAGFRTGAHGDSLFRSIQKSMIE